MNYLLSLCAVGVFALSCGCIARAAEPASTPLRHLVYSFSYGATGSVTVHDSGFSGEGGGAGSGVSSARQHDGANGTLLIDVLREQPDKGLVLSVSETSDSGRHKMNAATCVVYGNTTTICDPNATVNPEALSLIRVLGTNFVDPALVDAKQHWQFSNRLGDSSNVSDFTILKTLAGVMTISEDRHINYSGAHRGTAEANATISYDFGRAIPTSLTEISTGRVAEGGDYRDVKTEITLTLVKDSMASKP